MKQSEIMHLMEAAKVSIELTEEEDINGVLIKDHEKGVIVYGEDILTQFIPWHRIKSIYEV